MKNDFRSLYLLVSCWACRRRWSNPVHVAKVVEADLILVSTQLFSSEAYQRHFDSLSKPGLQVWDTSSLQLRKEPEAEADASPVPDELFHGEEASFEQGDLVRIHGLIAKAHLNGRQGQLIGWQEDTGRWSCLLAASKSSNVAWKRTRMKKDVRDRKKLGGRPESHSASQSASHSLRKKSLEPPMHALRPAHQRPPLQPQGSATRSFRDQGLESMCQVHCSMLRRSGGR